MTKTEACRKIGCSRQWANEIVSGRADEHREARKKAKQAKGGNKLSTVSASTTILTDEEYVNEISEEAFAKLEPLCESNWERYHTVCKELAKRFDEASVVPCHRVLAAGGKPGGFSANGGVVTKLKMLAIEGAVVNHTPSLFD